MTTTAISSFRFRRPTTIGVIGALTLTLQLVATAVARGPIALPGCPESCGGVQVPYPFGIGRGCSYQGFNLTCDESQHRPAKLLLADGVEVLDISVPDCTVRIQRKVSWVEYHSDEFFNGSSWSVPAPDGPLLVSSARNSFVAFGCNVVAKLIIPYDTTLDGPFTTYASVCAAVCGEMLISGSSSCSGVGCCRTSIASSLGDDADLRSYGIQIKSLEGETRYDYRRAAFLVDQDWFSRVEAEMARNFSNQSIAMVDSVPVVLEWSLDLKRDAGLFVLSSPIGPRSSDIRCLSSNSFSYAVDGNYDRRRCNCSRGYEGNPYVGDGCQDIDECQLPDIYPCHGTCINVPGTYLCSSKKSGRRLPGLIAIIATSAGFGLLFSNVGVASVINKLNQRRALRQKFFKRNHGLLLQQLISSNKDIAERMEIFSYEELEQATNKFDHNRIIGGGCHATIYKGILSDQRIVGIKRINIVVERTIGQLINEVAMLSQINHRNVVKLFGCCLETEVPLLVYEFTSNGTLSYHLHEKDENPLEWNDRLRIALETARAIAYLQCTASISVFHSDIKSESILLTNTLTAKVSDLGASRPISIDETPAQGTRGYLDPEACYTGRLTEKSDVYSFGVILAELLTRVRPVFYIHPLGLKKLGYHFVSMMKDCRLLDILDPQIVEEGGAEDAEVVARLAESCLSLKAEERPTMRQVEKTLEGVVGSKVHSGSRVSRTIQIVRKDQSHNRSEGNEGTRVYILEKEFIHTVI